LDHQRCYAPSISGESIRNPTNTYIQAHLIQTSTTHASATRLVPTFMQVTGHPIRTSSYPSTRFSHWSPAAGASWPHFQGPEPGPGARPERPAPCKDPRLSIPLWHFSLNSHPLLSVSCCAAKRRFCDRNQPARP
ncbi:hypothetical protein CSPX01_15225, partial [Colletotrichum filicis]